MNAIDLIHAQMALECIGINDAGEMIRITGPNPDTIARLYVVHYGESYYAYPRYDLPVHVRRKLHELPAELAFHDREIVQTILGKDGACDDVFVGKSYVFPLTIDPRDYLDAIRLGEHHRTLIDAYDPRIDLSRGAIHAIIQDGRIVSTCESSRENEMAAEAWVRTLPEYRCQGYARQVTAAWAHNLQTQRKIPFYSHRWDNSSSQAVAQSLRLIEYQTFVAYN